jgi:mRNA interferase MazF
MSFSPGDIVTVPFPYTDSLAEKRRPAVVVSSRRLERDHHLLWLAMITSSSRGWRGDVPISDLKAAGLPVRCVVRPAKIATASIARIRRKLGALRPADWRAVREGLARYRGGDR